MAQSLSVPATGRVEAMIAFLRNHREAIESQNFVQVVFDMSGRDKVACKVRFDMSITETLAIIASLTTQPIQEGNHAVQSPTGSGRDGDHHVRPNAHAASAGSDNRVK